MFIARTDNPNGEVRGHFDVEVIDVALGGQNKVPPVTTNATATVTFKRFPGLVEYPLDIANPSGVDFYENISVRTFTAERLPRMDQ
jgi:hypothetical protein